MPAINQNTNWTSLVVTMIAAINTCLIAFGVYHFNNEQLQALDTLVSCIGTVVGIFLTHTLAPAPDKPPEPKQNPLN